MLRARLALIAAGVLLAPLAAAAAVSSPAGSSSAVSAPAVSAPAVSSPAASSPAVSAPASGVSAASAVQPASAPAVTAPPSWIPSIPPLPVLDVIDAPRDYLSQQFVNFVTGVDRFFGNERNFQETNDSVLKLDLTRVFGYTSPQRFVLQGKAKVRLPNTEKRFHLMIESNPDINTANATSKIPVNQPVATTQTPSSYGAGVRLERQSAEKRWHIADDLGLKFAGLHTSPFARMRGSYISKLDGWDLNAAQTLFWFDSTGPGSTTQLDFERPIGEPYLLRVSSNATWTNTSQRLDLRQDVILFQKVDARTAMQYQASVVGLSDAHMASHVTDYVLLALYRHRLHRKWMYLEISPQLHFPEVRAYHPSGMLIVRLEVLFDRSR